MYELLQPLPRVEVHLACQEMNILPTAATLRAQMNSFPTIPVSVCGPLRELYLFIVKPFSIRSTQDNVERSRERERWRNRELFGEWRKGKYYYANRAGQQGQRVCVCVCVCVCVSKGRLGLICYWCEIWTKPLPIQIWVSRPTCSV